MKCFSGALAFLLLTAVAAAFPITSQTGTLYVRSSTDSGTVEDIDTDTPSGADDLSVQASASVSAGTAAPSIATASISLQTANPDSLLIDAEFYATGFRTTAGPTWAGSARSDPDASLPYRIEFILPAPGLELTYTLTARKQFNGGPESNFVSGFIKIANLNIEPQPQLTASLTAPADQSLAQLSETVTILGNPGDIIQLDIFSNLVAGATADTTSSQSFFTANLNFHTVPEPATAAFFAAGVSLLLRRRRSARR